MAERSTGINTRNPSDYVATFDAAEQAEGQVRLIQIVSLTSGKIDTAKGSPDRTVASNDSLDLTTTSGDVTVGDNAYLACYTEHSQIDGKCFVTPLLCDNDGEVVGMLPSKESKVTITTYSGSNYFSNCLSWEIRSTGAHKVFMHVSELSTGNSVDMRYFVF